MGKAELGEIAFRQLTALAERIRRRLSLEWAEEVPKKIAEKAMETHGGAREIRSIIRREVEDRLAALLLSPAPPTSVRLTIDGGEIVPTSVSPSLLPENSPSFKQDS